MEKLLSFEEAHALTGIRVPTWRAWAANGNSRSCALGAA